METHSQRVRPKRVIKPTIMLLCQHLHVWGFVGVAPELFRRAMLASTGRAPDLTQSEIGVLWSILRHACALCFTSLQHRQQDITLAQMRARALALMSIPLDFREQACFCLHVMRNLMELDANPVDERGATVLPALFASILLLMRRRFLLVDERWLNVFHGSALLAREHVQRGTVSPVQPRTTTPTCHHTAERLRARLQARRSGQPPPADVSPEYTRFLSQSIVQALGQLKNELHELSALSRMRAQLSARVQAPVCPNFGDLTGVNEHAQMFEQWCGTVRVSWTADVPDWSRSLWTDRVRARVAKALQDARVGARCARQMADLFARPSAPGPVDAMGREEERPQEGSGEHKNQSKSEGKLSSSGTTMSYADDVASSMEDEVKRFVVVWKRLSAESSPQSSQSSPTAQQEP